MPEYRARYARQVRILIYSQAASESEVKLAPAAGADAYAEKRASEADLLARVRHLLDQTTWRRPDSVW